jgi:membrane-associated protein
MFDLTHWVELYGAAVGYTALAGVIFAETGLFFGFFLPGDSILFPAGILASQGYLNIYLVCIVTFIAAVAGNISGYILGKYFGKRLFHKEDSVFFHKDHILRAKMFYDKYGGKTIIIGRFLAIIRTFAPLIAGISEMNFGQYLFYTVIGAALWAVGLPVAGFYLGKFIPDVDKYLLPVILLVVVLSLLPAMLETIRTKERRAAIKAHAHRILRRKKS